MIKIDAESINTATGANDAGDAGDAGSKTWIVMAEGNGIDESIGCEIPSKEGVLMFLNSFKDNESALEEFMPDSDYKAVTRLYIV